MTPQVGGDPEVRAIAEISAALGRLDDPEARRRVIGYIRDRFTPDLAIQVTPLPHVPSAQARLLALPSSQFVEERQESEIPGIAQMGEDGELRITIRDLKARSGLDAAVRLAHVAIFAYQRLTGTGLSSPRGLVPILKEWRLYDGNTRKRLALEKGILRRGELLTLDAHARQTAEKYVAEILDPDIQGRWRPS